MAAGCGVLDITGGQGHRWAGQMNGQGLGAVLFQSGTVTANTGIALNFTNGLFQWNGGALTGVASNLNVVILTGTNASANTGVINRSSCTSTILERSAKLETGGFDLKGECGGREHGLRAVCF